MLFVIMVGYEWRHVKYIHRKLMGSEEYVAEM